MEASYLNMLPEDCNRLIWSKVFNHCVKDIPRKVEYKRLIKEYNQCIKEMFEIEEKLHECDDWEERNDLLFEYGEIDWSLEEINLKLSRFYHINEYDFVDKEIIDNGDKYDVFTDDDKVINGYAFIIDDVLEDSDDDDE